MDKIILKEIPAGTPAQYLTGQALELDTLPGFSFRITQKLQELSEFENLTSNGVLGFEIPYTPKNDWALKLFRTASVLDNDYAPVPVICITDSEVLSQDLMFITGRKDRSQRYTIELSDVESFWKTKAEELKLCQIPLGLTLFDQATYEALWFQPSFVDGEEPVRWLLGDWGKLLNGVEGPIVPTDFRPLVSLHHMLVAGFCAIGYTFETPLASEDWYRRLYLYLLSIDFWKNENAGQQYGFRATQTADPGSPIAPCVVNWDDSTAPNYDSGDNHFNSVYTNNDDFPIQMCFCWAIPFDPADYAFIGNDFYFRVQIRLRDEADQTMHCWPQNEFFIDISEFTETTTWEFCLDDVEIPPGWDVTFDLLLSLNPYDPATAPNCEFIGGGDLQGCVPQNTVWWGIPCGKHFYPGDVLDIGTMLRCDKTFADLLKGVAHFGFKFETNYALDTVTMYPSNNTQVHGNEVEGYFRPYTSAVDISKFIEPESLDAKYPKSKLDRFIRYQFADAKDEYIKQQNYPDDKPPFYRLVDLGQHLKNEIKPDKNPFFEPTVNKITNGISMPVFWDNNDGELSTDIGPRIVYFEGAVRQKTSDGEDVRFNYESQILVGNNIPTSGQHIPILVDSGSGPRPIPENVMYGYRTSDLFEMFLKFIVWERRFAPEFNFLVSFTRSLYSQMDFRNPLFIHYQELTFVAKLFEIRDHRTNYKLTTPILVKPHVAVSDEICTSLCTYDGPTHSEKFVVDIILADGRRLAEISAFSFPYSLTSEAELLQFDMEQWLMAEDATGSFSVTVAPTNVTITDTVIEFSEICVNSLPQIPGSDCSDFSKTCN